MSEILRGMPHPASSPDSLARDTIETPMPEGYVPSAAYPGRIARVIPEGRRRRVTITAKIVTIAA